MYGHRLSAGIKSGLKICYDHTPTPSDIGTNPNGEKCKLANGNFYQMDQLYEQVLFLYNFFLAITMML